MLAAADANVAADADGAGRRAAQRERRVVRLVDKVDAAQLIPAGKGIGEEVEPGPLGEVAAAGAGAERGVKRRDQGRCVDVR